MSSKDNSARPLWAIPKRVVLRGRAWKVLVVDEIIDPGNGRRRKGVVGLTDRSARVIYISSSVRGARQREVFLHELLHACSRELVSARVEETLIEDVDAPLAKALAGLNW